MALTQLLKKCASVGERQRACIWKEKLNYGYYSVYFSVTYGLEVKCMEVHCRLGSVSDNQRLTAFFTWVCPHILSRPTSYVCMNPWWMVENRPLFSRYYISVAVVPSKACGPFHQQQVTWFDFIVLVLHCHLYDNHIDCFPYFPLSLNTKTVKAGSYWMQCMSPPSCLFKDSWCVHLFKNECI